MPVDPGEHAVRVTMPDGQTRVQTVTIAQGTSSVVEVVLPGPAPREPKPAAEAPPAVSHTWAFVALGVGAAGGVVAAVTGGLALAKSSTASQYCDAQGRCTSQTGVDAGRAAQGLANAETAALAVAGAGFAAAIVLRLTEPKGPTPSLSLGFDGSQASVRGSF
jgi:hypothetical protein